MSGKLEQMIATTLVIAMIAGCGTTTRSVRNYKNDRLSYEQAEISHSGLDLEEYVRKDPRILVNDFGAYLQFKKNYQGKISDIIRALENKNLSKVESDVRYLARALESDPNPYAKEQLEKVKEFNYIVYEVSNNMKARKIVNTQSFAQIVVWAPFAIAFDAIGLVFMKKPEFVSRLFDTSFPEDLDYRSVKTTFNKVRVTPYSGRRDVIESDVAY
jgi:hypothetical protein